MPKASAVLSSPKAEQFTKDLAAEIQRLCQKEPDISNLQIIVALAKMAGRGIAMVMPNERDLLKAIALENLELSLAETAKAIDASNRNPKPPIPEAKH